MLRSSYVTNSSLYFKVFSEQQCEEIHSAVLEVLERVGVIMHHPKALEIVKKAGAYVEGNSVKFPPALVEKCIRSAPSRIILCDRNGNRKIHLENSKFFFGTGPTTNYTIDPFTGERKNPTIEDTARAAKVMDALPNIDYVMDFGTAKDVRDDIADVYMFEAMLNNTTKPIVHWGYNVQNYKAMVDMAVAVCGSLQYLRNNPFLCFYSEPISPLQHDYDALDKTIYMAENFLPCINTPCPLAGTTAPSTLAGTIVMSFAESLSSLVISQLVNEGTPVVIGGTISLMDMKTTQITYASPEFSLMAAGLANMAQYYKIPAMTTAGCTDSKCVDQQAGIDIATNCLMAALSGGNLIHDVGYMESGVSSSLQLLVIADEVISQVKRLVRGIEVNKETLALDVIENVGPGGHFMAEKHTFDNFKKEWWFPEIFNRDRYDTWAEKEKPDLGLIANKKLREILKNHKIESLNSKTNEKIRNILLSL